MTNSPTLRKKRQRAREGDWQNGRKSGVAGVQGGCSKGSAICLLFVSYLFAICLQIEFMSEINLKLHSVSPLPPSYPLPTRRIAATSPPQVAPAGGRKKPETVLVGDKRKKRGLKVIDSERKMFIFFVPLRHHKERKKQ